MRARAVLKRCRIGESRKTAGSARLPDRSWLLQATLLLLVAGGLAACEGDSSRTGGGAAGVAKAGNPDRGEQIYRANCFTCHGVDPAHDGPLGPSIQGSSRELVVMRLTKGGRHYPAGYTPKRKTTVMPPQAHLLPDVDHLLAYINMDHAAAAAAAEPAAAEPTDPVVERGRAAFAPTCGACHQPDGSGRPGLAPSVTDQDFLALASDDFIKTTIKLGRPGTNMISFAFFPDEKIDEIVAYLRSFQKEPARKYDRSWKATGSQERGEAMYAAVCSQCHGINGKGYLMGGSGTAIGLNGFLSAADDGYIKQVMLSGREGTPMRAFGGPQGLAQISDQDMNDIIVHLRHLGGVNAAR